jgi:arabinofuranosyltransferase
LVDSLTVAVIERAIDYPASDDRQFEARASRPSSSRIVAGLLVALPVSIVFWQGWAHRWVADDAYIDFRVISNLTSGRGPVYNPGERVEVFTDPLWVAILSIFHFLSFLPIQWWAVLLGLCLTGLGVGLAARAGQQMGTITDGPGWVVVPLGMLVFVAVDAVWDFATSGLETGLILGWAGCSWWLLVNHLERRGRPWLSAAVIGAGPLIRPDMALISLALLAGLAAITTEERARWDAVRCVAAQLALAFALPMAYEVFRAAYFGMLVPNTALAKTAGSSWWSQGLTYVKDMIGPYWLWFPLILAGLTLARRLGHLASTGRSRIAVVVAAPVVGGLLDALYVVKVGGDFMHGRMLLPGFFLMCMSFFVPLRSARHVAVVTAGSAWVFAATAFLHYPDGSSIVNGIANERGWYIAHALNPHPVTPNEYVRSDFGQVGVSLNNLASVSNDPGGMLVLLEPNQGDISAGIAVPATMPEKVVAPVFNVGISGQAAGPDVYIFDELSLSNPIGAHIADTGRTRPGHSQVVGTVWMVARFVPPSEWRALEDNSSAYLASIYNMQDLAAAHAALSCGTLHSYLQSITGPMTAGRAISNLFHSFSYTNLRFSPRPTVAERELCGHGSH